jgi:hypothetical protein
MWRQQLPHVEIYVFTTDFNPVYIWRQQLPYMTYACRCDIQIWRQQIPNMDIQTDTLKRWIALHTLNSEHTTSSSSRIYSHIIKNSFHWMPSRTLEQKDRYNRKRREKRRLKRKFWNNVARRKIKLQREIYMFRKETRARARARATVSFVYAETAQYSALWSIVLGSHWPSAQPRNTGGRRSWALRK